MKWILLAVLSVQNGLNTTGGGAISQEFATEAACEAAKGTLDVLAKRSTATVSVRSACVPAGQEGKPAG